MRSDYLVLTTDPVRLPASPSRHRSSPAPRSAGPPPCVVVASWPDPFEEMAILSWESLGSGDVVDVQVEEQLVGSPLGFDDGGLWPIPLLFVGQVFLDMRFQFQEVRPDSDPSASVIRFSRP